MTDVKGIHFPRGLFWALLIPVAMVAVVVAFSFREKSVDSEAEQVLATEGKNLQQLSGFIAADVFSLVHRLDILSHEAALQHAIDMSTPHATRLLDSLFRTLVKGNLGYQQIRWIDESGAERVRVNASRDSLSIISANQLEDVSARDYFRKAITLADGEIYLSGIDSNNENSGSGNPQWPTIRLAAPIRSTGGQRRGILVIDVVTPYMQEVLRIAQEETPDTDYMVVSGDGYAFAPSTLRKPTDSESELYAEFQRTYPIAWKRISSSRAGSADLEDGIWVWKEMIQMPLIARIATATSGGSFDTTRIHPDDLSLRIVAHKSASALATSTLHITVPIVVGTALLLCIYALSLLFVLHGQEREKHAAIEAAHAKAQAIHLQRLKELEERFHLSVEASSVGMLVVDAEGTIVISNTAAESMLGYEKHALKGLSVDSLLQPGQRDRHEQLRAEFLRNPEVRKMGQGRKLEAVRADGRKILVEVGLNPYLDHGKQVVLASVIDLSDKI